MRMKDEGMADEVPDGARVVALPSNEISHGRSKRNTGNGLFIARNENGPQRVCHRAPGGVA